MNTVTIISKKIYKIISISREQKVFYACNIENSEDIDYFPILGVSFKDVQLVKKDSIFTAWEEYIDSSSGSRTHGLRLEFKEAVDAEKW